MEVRQRFISSWRPDQEFEAQLIAGAVFGHRLSFRSQPPFLSSSSTDDYRRGLSRSTTTDKLHRERGAWVATALDQPYGLLFQETPTVGKSGFVVVPRLNLVRARAASVEHSHGDGTPPSRTDWVTFLRSDHLSMGLATPQVRYALFKSDDAPVSIRARDIKRVYREQGDEARQQTVLMKFKLANMRDSLGSSGRKRYFFENRLWSLATAVAPDFQLLEYIEEVFRTKLMGDCFKVVVYRSKTPGVYMRLDDQVLENIMRAFDKDLQKIYSSAQAA